MSEHGNVFPEQIDADEKDYLYIKRSGVLQAGKGLFSSIPIFKNEIVAVYRGEILSKTEADIRAKKGLDAFFIIMPTGSVLDSNNTVCFAKFANDALGFSASKFKNNSTIVLDSKNQICLVAMQKIKANQEIFCSYGKAYWNNFNKNSN